MTGLSPRIPPASQTAGTKFDACHSTRWTRQESSFIISSPISLTRRAHAPSPAELSVDCRTRHAPQYKAITITQCKLQTPARATLCPSQTVLASDDLWLQISSRQLHYRPSSEQSTGLTPRKRLLRHRFGHEDTRARDTTVSSTPDHPVRSVCATVARVARVHVLILEE